LLRNFRLRSFILLLGLFGALILQSQAQQKDEVGLVIGATIPTGVNLASGVSVPPPQSLTFNSSLALGVEYDRRFISGRTAIYGGVDFLASPLDVKLNQPPSTVSPEYAYIFLAPHVRVKFNARGALEPWLSFGGGYTRFHEAAPTTAPNFKGGTNTGTLEFGGGVDTAPLVHLLRIPIGARFEVRDFYSGTPDFNQQLDTGKLNSLAYTGGLLLRF